MSTLGKSIATTISMIAVVLSLAFVGPTSALGKGNKRIGNTTRFQRGVHLTDFGRGDLRSAASGTRNPKQGNFLLVGGAGGAGSVAVKGNAIATYARK